MITSHNHSSFTVSDLERSVAFYRDLLGFTEENRFETRGAGIDQITALPGAHLKVAHLLLGGFRLELIEYLSPGGRAIDLSTNNVGSAHIAFYADDVEETYRELSEKGVRFKGSPVAAAHGRPGVAYFLDPDGITLELSEHIQPK
ncbi:MAG: VOC family protein [Chloroflexi bacterium]|nr:VOC family protein [Chloroflexota bacterium]